jgi:hypothetical protein
LTTARSRKGAELLDTARSYSLGQIIHALYGIGGKFSTGEQVRDLGKSTWSGEVDK